jgi:hypothetical protein
MMKQQERIIQCLKTGWVSGLDALRQAKTMKLSTRVGELKNAGWNIQSMWSTDGRYKLYRLVKPYQKSQSKNLES